MSQPFYEAANKVLTMYALRQERDSALAPAHSDSEIFWACAILEGLSLAAAYAGSKEAVAIRNAVDSWIANEKIPELFILEEAEQ
ncbi:Uncharacterised protein [Serratia marcescens]|uniref:hypothetical protein n=1 Tax=Serratia TaxID=613 RepID=UPI00217AC856|nr:hypothetical protein [Serratia marcescens]CAI0722112.1 Uncharacterised protein [Serratia marcescens]CAI0874951.1 Uncharacterised protein [Serratia marcescens]